MKLGTSSLLDSQGVGKVHSGDKSHQCSYGYALPAMILNKPASPCCHGVGGLVGLNHSQWPMGGGHKFTSDTTGKVYLLLYTVIAHTPAHNPKETHWPHTKDVKVERGLAGKRVEIVGGRKIMRVIGEREKYSLYTY